MKKRVFTALLLAASLLLCSCGAVEKLTRSGDFLLHPYGVFEKNGVSYVLFADRSSTSREKTAVVDKDADAQVCSADDGHMVYCENTGLLYFADGCRLMSISADGIETRKLSRVPHKNRHDRLSVCESFADLLILRLSYASIEGMGQHLKFRCSFPSEMYYLYNTKTEELTAFIDEGGSGIAPVFLEEVDNNIYYVQLDPQEGVVKLFSKDLSSLEKTELCSLEGAASAEGATGCFRDGTFYICCSEKLYSVPSEDPGAVKQENFAPEAMFGIDGNITVPLAISSDNGKLYVLAGAEYEVVEGDEDMTKANKAASPSDVLRWFTEEKVFVKATKSTSSFYGLIGLKASDGVLYFWHSSQFFTEDAQNISVMAD